MATRQYIGYKLVELPDGRRGVATLNIPKTATVVETGYKAVPRGATASSASPILMRTDDVVTMSIVPIGGKPGDCVLEGKSIRGYSKLAYKVGQHTTSTLNIDENKGNGIHFFWDPKTPKLWDNLFIGF